jgi:hypothetical protein
MIDPWTILGLVAVGLAATLLLVARTFGRFGARVYRDMHRETRDTPPTAGQVWVRGDTKLRIKRITRAGRIVVRCGTDSWCDSAEAWRNRVINQKLKLEKES